GRWGRAALRTWLPPLWRVWTDGRRIGLLLSVGDGRPKSRVHVRPAVGNGSAWKGTMKLLLTSAGIKNRSIENALVDLLGKPIAESDALCIPTAQYGHPNVGPGAGPWRFISGREPRTPMCELGWKSVGVLELTALPTIDQERWVPLVRDTDVLLVAGGDA